MEDKKDNKKDEKIEQKEDPSVDDLIEGIKNLKTEDKKELSELEIIANLIKEGKAKKIIIMSGAGISVAAG